MAHFYLQVLLLLVVLTVISECRECKSPQVVQAASGTVITLSCPVNITSEKETSQNISWVMLKGNGSRHIKSTSMKINGTTLVIDSVQDWDSGWYRCKDMNTLLCFDIFLQIQVLTTSEMDWNTKKEGSRVILPVVVISVSVMVVITAALIGQAIICRLNTGRAAHETQNHSADIHMETIEDILITTQSQDLTNHQVDSLYQQFQEESLHTFHY
ncbi:uncharacterized protein wu:fb59e12 [Antennarius striatus]|uniref:uncharacterized protein wu:fb59e12 n=1 Tax=Antennarius striatus TaxID=241820 RepID=UPI0035AE6E88